MGQGQSQQDSKRPPRVQVPVEQVSHEIALQFATKCYTHLEIAHYKDNFKSLADHNDDLEYWKEDTLCRFFAIPEPLRAGAGAVLHSMAVYLGAFPFPSTAPVILTREAMLKVITILTDRYKKILKRADKDKTKLLFRSLAVFDRRVSTSLEKLVNRGDGEKDMAKEVETTTRSHVSGFAIDDPGNDDNTDPMDRYDLEEEEDDDDLALAALDALDAIEVFKHDSTAKVDRKINHATIPAENLKHLVMLLLLLGGLEAQTPLAAYADGLDEQRLSDLEQSASAIIAAFDPDPITKGISYSNFVKTISTTMPDLFLPLNALFEHLLFSKTLDLSRHKGAPSSDAPSPSSSSPIVYNNSGSNGKFPLLLTDTLLSQLSVSLHVLTPSASLQNIFDCSARFHHLFSTAVQGTSLSSFSRQVTSWSSATLFIVSGTVSSSSSSSSSSTTPIILGAYLPTRWRDSTHNYSTTTTTASSESEAQTAAAASLFQLSPRHSIFPANPYYNNRDGQQHAYFNQKSGIALGCVVPAQSRTSSSHNAPVPGPVSIQIDTDFATGTFHHDPEAGTSSGAFKLDPGLAHAQLHDEDHHKPPHHVSFDIDTLEVWGISVHDDGGRGDSEVEKQQKRLKWEEEEAARRRGVNFGADKDGARSLLEMAGLVGDKAGNGRSGGSV